MLLRLILVLMLAFGAPVVPAAAHQGMEPMAMAGHQMPGGDHGRDRKAPMPEHFCVGCVPAGDWDAARVRPPIVLPALPPIARIASLLLLPGEAPAPPPPRMA